MNLGIDISTYQNGIDLKKAKEEGVQFVIIRGGFTGYANKTMAKDDRFEEHYNNALNNKLDIGVYYYSRATSYEEGKKEAEFLYENCLKNKTFNYPIYIDIEDSYYQLKSNKEDIDAAITGFCEYIESKNGYAGVYCNLNWAENKMNYNKLAEKFDFWLAYWGNEAPKKERYGNYGIWQFGGETNYVRSNKIANKICDQNYSFKNYNEIMNNMKLNYFIEDKENNKEIDKISYIDKIYTIVKKIIDYLFSKIST